MNMAIRTAIAILVPLRTFNARDYQLLYFQSRRTNWHQYFTAEQTLRIDVNGSSPNLRNTQYVIHRVKDGIVDTFRKLNQGIRPSIDKGDPDIHILVHLDGNQVTLYLDSAGAPLFKRGYRERHGGAPLKEDLAAGILQLAGIEEAGGLIDPMCGSGTLLFEGWMLMNRVAPNLHRSFAFQNWLDYREDLHLQERERLRGQECRQTGLPIIGGDLDPLVMELARSLHEEFFPEAPIEWITGDVRDLDRAVPGGLMVTNPPYGERLGKEEDLGDLYRELGYAARRCVPGGKLALFTTNRKAARRVPMRAGQAVTLFNGSLEGLLYPFAVRA